MEQHIIEVERRTGGNKGDARKLRAAGKIPGILYGHKEAPQAFSVSPKVLRKMISDSGMGRNTVLQVRGLERDVMALLKEAQVDPVRRHLLHVDLIEIRESDRVEVDIPIDFQGKPVGVVNGGELQIIRRSVPLTASPLSIPKSISIDLTPMDIGDTWHISDLEMPEGTTSTAGRLGIAAIKQPRAVEEETTEEEGVEGAEAPADAEGDAPAAPAPAAS